MILVVGGAYQGKLDYALNTYGKTTICDGNTCTLEDTLTCEVLNDFQLLVRRYFKTLNDATNYLDRLLQCNPNVVIVSTEVGCGIVPLHREDRDYRELIGRVCCEVSRRAESVVRVFCGIGKALK
jgi:adenosyl cobinamide kinase/adenosyl cobinamide phosphate guanylyltransferase